MNWETFNWLPALEKVKGVIRSIQTFAMVLLAKRVSKVNLKTLTILAKRLILDAWLGPGQAFANGYITVLKVQTEICKDGRWVKMESF